MRATGDTICAPATIAGTGAIALIRVSGPDALKCTDSVISFRHGSASEANGYSLKFGNISDVDDVLVSVFRSPHSYTGEDSVEISCHASSYIVSRILELLTEAGCRIALPGEFTQRAFVNGKMDLAQAEAVADVIASSTEAEHRIAMSQLRGGYSEELKEIRSSLLELSALLELELDFSEEDVEFADRKKLYSLSEAAMKHCQILSESFHAGNAVKNGIPTTIAGAPNCGKSTLLNALLGEDRAIVSDVPGTTRDTVEEVFVLGGLKFRLIDTAGLRKAGDKVERMGIERSRAAMKKADIVISVVDGSSVTPEDAARRFIDPEDGQTVIRVLSKADLMEGRGNAAPDTGFSSPDSSVSPIRLSALTGEGMDRLKKAVLDAGTALTPRGAGQTLVTNARHATALRASATSLSAVLDGLASGLSGDLVAEDLRSAIASLNTILGSDAITTQDTLNSIFSEFCIGK